MLVNSDGEVLKEFDHLINPEYIIKNGEKIGKLLDPDGIMRISGIDTADLVDEPVFSEVAPQIREMFAEADQVIAHNLPFDRTLMELELNRFDIKDWPWPKRQTCTVEEHIPKFGYRVREKDLYQYYMGKPLDQTHRALDDVMALLEICKCCGVLHK